MPILPGNTKVFLSFDIDFVDPAYAPGTGTPEAGGFSSGETLKIIRGLKDLDFIGFDVVEVLPSFDPSEITALLAANVVYEFISILACFFFLIKNRTITAADPIITTTPPIPAA